MNWRLPTSRIVYLAARHVSERVARRGMGEALMVDPISFPFLAGAALTGAVNFLYNRLGAVLDRRHGKIAADTPEVIEGHTTPVQLHLDALDEGEMARLEQLAQQLRIYQEHPEILREDDQNLRRLLGEVRKDLEAIYGLPLRFDGEENAEPGIRIIQESEEVEGVQRAIKARAVSPNAQIATDQRARVIRRGGEQTGLEIEGTIG